LNLEDYRSFEQALRRKLEADPRVLGLIAVGSMARRETQPDDWSDHDFLVVVGHGTQEEFRNRVDWLPDPERLVYRFRETAHGVKALYDHGHLIEFAVFDPDELYVARIDQYRVVFDRADVTRRMAEVGRATADWMRSEAPGDEYLAGQLVTAILVAYGRWARGERLSARAFLGQAVGHFVRPGVAASIDPQRRFERGYPALGAALDEVLVRPVPAAAAGLLELARRELAARMPSFPAAAADVVRRRMA
jgi:predicted nucleotidyltransferase